MTQFFRVFFIICIHVTQGSHDLKVFYFIFFYLGFRLAKYYVKLE